jgi:hypothetical protein
MTAKEVLLQISDVTSNGARRSNCTGAPTVSARNFCFFSSDFRANTRLNGTHAPQQALADALSRRGNGTADGGPIPEAFTYRPEAATATCSPRRC